MPSECVDGKWRFTGYDSLSEMLGREVVRECDGRAEWVERGIFLPVYKFWSYPPDPYSIITDQPYSPCGNRYAGRVIVDRREITRPEYMANLGPTDVVHWPLYRGGPMPKARRRGTRDKLTAYGENLARLREVGPGLLGVVVGNAGFELAAHQWLPHGDTLKERDAWRRAALRFVLDFIHETGDLLKGMGVQPAWSPMDRELLMDCYHWDGAMAEAITSYGGWLIICQEGAFFPRWTCIFGNEGQDGRHLGEKVKPGITKDGELVGPIHKHQPGFTDWDARCVEWEAREVYPYRGLLEYFRRYPVWHCIGYDMHLKAGYDRLLTMHGVRALIY